MCTKDELKTIVSSVSEMYRQQYKDNIRSIFLYGSYARGDNTIDSDIDMVAIVDGDREALQQGLKVIWDESAELGFHYDVIVSPTVVPSQEYEEYKDVLPYYRNIAREGIRVG